MNTFHRGLAGVVALLAVGCERGVDVGDPSVAGEDLTFWSTSEEGRLGSLDRPGEFFGAVLHVAIGPDETLYVHDPTHSGIRVFDRDGIPLSDIGGRGQGPGEYSGASSIGFRADTFFIADNVQRRISYFTERGDVVASREWVTELFSSGIFTFYPTVPQVPLADGTGLVAPLWAYMPTIDFQQPGVHRMGMHQPYLRVDERGQVLDTVAWVETAVTSVTFTHGGNSHFVTFPREHGSLFSSAWTRSQLLPGGGVVVADETPSSDSGRHDFGVTLFGVMGDTVFHTRIPYTPVPVEGEHVRLALGSVPSRALGSPPGSEPSGSMPTAADEERAAREAGVIPSTWPPVTEVAAGQDGTIWLRGPNVPTEETIPWYALSADGRVEGAIRLPQRQSVMTSLGDLVVAVELDEFEVPYVVRHRIEGW